jgi:hypothetical protein
MKRRTATIFGALALVAVLAIGTAAAAGFGTFAVSILNGGAQQGGVSVTGACQDGQPITLEFAYGYDVGEFAIESVTLTGIEAACVGGVLVINGGGPATSIATIPAPVAGVAEVILVATVPVGDADTIDILLTE